MGLTAICARSVGGVVHSHLCWPLSQHPGLSFIAGAAVAVWGFGHGMDDILTGVVFLVVIFFLRDS